jgi:hypothetical protein
MPITYTNRKRITYYLNLGFTKTGKARYYFAREPKDRPLEEIPEGYSISESVNGVVSLVKDRLTPFLPEEIGAVEEAVQRHPKAGNYRVSVKPDRIEVNERVGPDLDELIAELRGLVPLGQDHRLREIRELQERRARFTPVVRFILQDTEGRNFGVQRMCYLGSIDGWIDVLATGSVGQLVWEVIPKLGTDEFFELY